MTMRFRFLLSVLGLLILASGSIAVAANIPGDLTGPWQLFIDDYLVASKTNVQRRYHQFNKYKDNPLIVVDKPWERDVVVCSTVLPNEDGSGYRMYYGSWAAKNDPEGGYTCLATSKDGLKWEKPNLGIHKWCVDGKTDNNILTNAGGHVIYAPWEKDPERRYYSFDRRKDGYHVYSSPDGLHWKQLSKKAIISGGDTCHFYRDPHTKLFRCTVKGASGKVSGNIRGLRRRVVGFSETADVTHFPPLRMVMAPDDTDDLWCKPGSVQRTHFYACPVVPYETMYVGMLQIYRAAEPEGYFHGPLWLEMVSSRDGMHWLREEPDTSVHHIYGINEISRKPLLDIGKFREFDDGMVFSNSLLLVDDEIRMYYSGYDELHDWLPYSSCIGLATLRKDGFASLDADEVQGEIETCKLTGVSGPMQVNCDPRGGSVRVEVLDADGKVIPGYGRDDCEPVTSNGVHQNVTWKSHKELPADAGAVRFRFLLDHASLYSFLAGDNVKATPEPSGTPLQALYTFESGRNGLTDMLGADGLQALRIMGTSVLDYKEPDPAFGGHSLQVGSTWRPHNCVEIEGTTDLGRHFSLGAMVKNTNGKLARLFSSYSGNFPIGSSDLIFDFDPRCKVVDGMRLFCKGVEILSDPVKFDDKKYHHVAVTYDDGRVTFYLDGKQVGEEWMPGGEPVKLARNLLIGEDLDLGSDEQLMGNVDDLFVLGWVLSPEVIKDLAEKGAEAVMLKPAGGGK